MGIDMAALRKIRVELARQTVLGLWQAGRLMNKAMDEENTRFAQIVRMARLLGGEEKVSLLQQACRLARYWTKDETRVASSAGLSIRRSIALMALDGLAERYSKSGDVRTARRIRADRRRLMSKGAKLTVLDLHAAKSRYASSGRRRKRVSDSQRFILSQLEKVKSRLLADVTLAGNSSGSAIRRLAFDLDRLVERVERRYALILNAVVS